MPFSEWEHVKEASFLGCQKVTSWVMTVLDLEDQRIYLKTISSLSANLKRRPYE